MEVRLLALLTSEGRALCGLSVQPAKSSPRRRNISLFKNREGPVSLEQSKRVGGVTGDIEEGSEAQTCRTFLAT